MEIVEAEVEAIEIDNEIVDKLSEPANETSQPAPADRYAGKDEYSYLSNPGFSSEVFKIELKNLPRFYGYGELKKMVNVTCKIECNKIKIPKKNSSFGFLCFRNDEDRDKAIAALNGFKWKGSILKAVYARPALDPLVRKRKQDEENDQSRGSSKKQKTVAEGSEPLGHLSYEEQLATKQKKIEEVLRQFKRDLKKANDIQRRTAANHSDELICELRQIIGSPLTEGYRNKCEFTIGKTVEGEIMVGNRLSSYASGCTSVASIEDLKMPTEKMKLAVKLLRDFIIQSGYQPFNTETYGGIFRNLTIRQNRKNDGLMLIIGIHPQELTDEEKEKIQQEFVSFFTEGAGKSLNVTSLYYEEMQKRQSGQSGNNMKHIYGATHIEEYILGLKFRISPNSFFQANSSAAEKLYQLAIDLADVKEDTTVLDICCGTGTIGLCFAKYCKQVYGMEIIPEAIADANVNASENGIKNAEFKAGNADDLIYTMVKQASIGKDETVVAIVDPPRAGLQTKSITQLRNSEKIKRLVYISCSPSQVLKNFVDLCKNCSKTMKGDPFVPVVAVPVDMFPHTPHCELVVLFERVEPEPVEEEAVEATADGAETAAVTEDTKPLEGEPEIESETEPSEEEVKTEDV